MVNHKLRAARKAKAWTLEMAAEKVGVSVVTFSRWEKGTQTPYLPTVRDICKAFHKSPQDLGLDHLLAEPDEEETKQVAPLSEPQPIAEPLPAQPAPLVRLTGEQVAAFLSVLEDTTIMKAIQRRFDPAKRATLHMLKGLCKDAAFVAGAAPLLAELMNQESDPEPWERLSHAAAEPSALNPATFDHFERLLGQGWELIDLNELAAAEGILSSFLPKIRAIPSREVTAKIAYLASQGLRLQSVLVHHRADLPSKVLLCQQAVEYARHTQDTNTLVTALIELAAAYKFEGQMEKRLSTLQEALGCSLHASPLVRSRAYSNTATALAESGRVQEAQLYIRLARDVFPTHAAGDPAFALADSSIFTLSYHAGKVYMYAGNIPEAFAAFELYTQYAPDIIIPERIRLEIVNAQSRAAIGADDLDQYVSVLESALVGALTLGSKKRFDEAYRIFQEEMPASWLANHQIKTVAERYHLKRKS